MLLTDGSSLRGPDTEILKFSEVTFGVKVWVKLSVAARSAFAAVVVMIVRDVFLAYAAAN